MKIFNILLIASLMTVSLGAQSTVNKSFQTQGVTTLKGDFTWGDVSITNWNENRIEISASVSINNGENDESFTIESNQSGSTLSIKTFIKNMDKLPKMVTVRHNGEKYTFKKGNNYKKQIEDLKKELGVDKFKNYNTGVDVDIQLSIKLPAGLKLELESTYGGINLDKCANAMAIHNTYGSIKAVFDSQSKAANADLFSTYSYVDVSVPANSNLDVVMHTNYGSLFTDMDINIDKSASEEKAFYNKVVGKVNQGGSSLKLKATYNNVYLRRI